MRYEFMRVEIIFALVMSLVLGACSHNGGSSGGSDNGDNSNNAGGDGGDTQTYTIGGTISGNDGSVTLSLNGAEQSFSGSSFTFTATVNKGDGYLVQFVSESTGQRCIVTNGVGLAQTNINNIAVNCAGPSTTLRFENTEVLGSMVSGDFNGDGIKDLAFNLLAYSPNPYGNNVYFVRFLYGAGGGVFTRQADVFNVGSSIYSKALAFDANNDGLSDFLFNAGNIYIYGGNEDAPSFLGTETPGPNIPSTMKAADVNKDGLDDLVGVIFHSGTAYFYGALLNNGDGSFADVAPFDMRDNTDHLWVPMNIALADFNGDGTIDVLGIGQAYSGVNDRALQLVPGNGDGTFNAPDPIQPLPADIRIDPDVVVEPKVIATGDFDSDGDIDIAITSDNTFLLVMKNDGHGVFSVAQRVTVGLVPRDVKAADMNNDGILDLISLNEKSQTLNVSFGFGDGTFGDNTADDASWVEIQLDRDMDHFGNLVIDDLDGDSALDVAFAEEGSNPSKEYYGSVNIFYDPGL